MFAGNRERVFVAGLVVVHVVAMTAVLGLVFGWWSSDPEEPASVAPVTEPGPGAGVDGPTITPTASLSLITATPVTPTATPEAATATPEPPSPSPTPEPTSTPAVTDTPVPQPATATPTAPPAAPASGPADFSGRWRIVDTVTEGSNAGQSFSFEVTLVQDGKQVSGGNSGIQMAGVVSGDTALLEYSQPALGYTGTFIWTMVSEDRATGSFTSSHPNAGTSTLLRLQ